MKLFTDTFKVTWVWEGGTSVRFLWVQVLRDCVLHECRWFVIRHSLCSTTPLSCQWLEAFQCSPWPSSVSSGAPGRGVSQETMLFTIIHLSTPRTLPHPWNLNSLLPISPFRKIFPTAESEAVISPLSLLQPPTITRLGNLPLHPHQPMTFI